MNLDEGAVTIAREVMGIDFREARKALGGLIRAGCSMAQAMAILRAPGQAGFVCWSVFEFGTEMAAILSTTGLERRKGTATLECGHEITTGWCAECAVHTRIKPA